MKKIFLILIVILFSSSAFADHDKYKCSKKESILYGAELLANNAIHAGVFLELETKLPKDKIETDLKLIYDNEIIDTWNNKMWPVDMLSELNLLVKEQTKNNNYLKKGDLILTGTYGFSVPINDKKLIEVTSSTFDDVKASFE